MKRNELSGTVRRSAALCALAMLGLSVRLFAAESGCTREALGRAQAVAHMRVTKLADELQENGVQHLATLTLCGAAGGLGETREVTVQLAADKDGHTDFSVPIGSRCVVLLAPRGGGWQLAGWLGLTDDGKFVDEQAGRSLDLKVGEDADAVVLVLEAKLKKAGHPAQERPKPPPTGRNQPWNLMRASPLRRVWPFPY